MTPTPAPTTRRRDPSSCGTCPRSPTSSPAWAPPARSWESAATCARRSRASRSSRRNRGTARWCTAYATSTRGTYPSCMTRLSSRDGSLWALGMRSCARGNSSRSKASSPDSPPERSCTPRSPSRTMRSRPDAKRTSPLSSLTRVGSTCPPAPTEAPSPTPKVPSKANSGPEPLRNWCLCAIGRHMGRRKVTRAPRCDQLQRRAPRQRSRRPGATSERCDGERDGVDEGQRCAAKKGVRQATPTHGHEGADGEADADESDGDHGGFIPAGSRADEVADEAANADDEADGAEHGGPAADADKLTQPG